MFVTTLNTGDQAYRERGGWEEGGRCPKVLCDSAQPSAQPAQLPAPSLCIADCSLARKLYAAGYEIADHTITHPHVSAQQPVCLWHQMLITLGACGRVSAPFDCFSSPPELALPTIADEFQLHPGHG